MKTKQLFVLFLSTLFFISCTDESSSPTSVRSTSSGKVYTYNIFNKERVAFSNTHQQSVEKDVKLINNIDNVKQILMYVGLTCPSGGCNAWDVYANVQVFNSADNKWYELGRYITPYKVTTEARGRGFEFDITDFKALLINNAKIKIFTEVWGSDGWEVTVDFDYIEGAPDYKYYSVAEVFAYNKNSIEGIPYGETDENINKNYITKKNISFPQNVEESHFRTIISGWGHATPYDVGGRGCAEWCFRTHHIAINDNQVFEHELGPLGCQNNPIRPQYGNWSGDRAGWCPGMEVPTRIDVLNSNLRQNPIKFEYQFEKWVNDKKSPADNPNAYYAISNYIVLKSNSPIEAAKVANVN